MRSRPRQQAKDKLDAANAEAARIIADAQTTANASLAANAKELAALSDKQRFAAKTLSDTNAQVAQAQAQYDAIQTGMQALKARLG